MGRWREREGEERGREEEGKVREGSLACIFIELNTIYKNVSWSHIFLPNSFKVVFTSPS